MDEKTKNNKRHKISKPGPGHIGQRALSR